MNQLYSFKYDLFHLIHQFLIVSETNYYRHPFIVLTTHLTSPLGLQEVAVATTIALITIIIIIVMVIITTPAKMAICLRGELVAACNILDQRY